mmetsp:Transcript_36696/g.67777  ORF Transcript_36696/g.67777 Transcript_36696/m.67777 type:complete len:295 (-) Transcript_36696:191-1075(-)|eukprot:CAMPEP_0170171618 /NCGR_PEP_ID=MMETSP0040_2-20121228/4785_1 /TAXON_ID=641309 /ORGANISM="Lotharella oceanica, Strain CCMP622" /LENGTH=294 /DNA_ID=CAMNT_0010411791 /DNA_START=252 /DNA_END=1136 /DNA_ORIENTATION=+
MSFNTGPSKVAMARMKKGIDGMIEDKSQWNQEFKEGRGKTVWEDGLIAHGLKEAPAKTEGEILDEKVLQAYLNKQDIEKQNAKKKVESSSGLNRCGSCDSDTSLSDDDDTEFILKYRAMRLAEITGACGGGEGGNGGVGDKGGTAIIRQQAEETLETISHPDFKEKVVVKSIHRPVVMLIFSGTKECDTLAKMLKTLSFKFKQVSFYQIEVSDMLRNVPKEDCPIVMVYNNGIVIGQFVKLDSFAGAKTTSEVVEWKLSKLGILKTTLEEDPMPRFQIRRTAKQQKDEIDDADD